MRLIIVEGPKSSGKTMAIKEASRRFGVDFSDSPVADIQCITQIRIGVSNRLIAMTSSGDSAAIIRENISFLKDHDLYAVVCACSAFRSGRPLWDAFALLRRAETIVIKTEKNDSADNRTIARIAETVAAQIADAVSG